MIGNRLKVGTQVSVKYLIPLVEFQMSIHIVLCCAASQSIAMHLLVPGKVT